MEEEALSFPVRALLEAFSCGTAEPATLLLLLLLPWTFLDLFDDCCCITEEEMESSCALLAGVFFFKKSRASTTLLLVGTFIDVFLFVSLPLRPLLLRWLLLAVAPLLLLLLLPLPLPLPLPPFCCCCCMYCLKLLPFLNFSLYSNSSSCAVLCIYLVWAKSWLNTSTCTLGPTVFDLAWADFNEVTTT